MYIFVNFFLELLYEFLMNLRKTKIQFLGLYATACECFYVNRGLYAARCRTVCLSILVSRGQYATAGKPYAAAYESCFANSRQYAVAYRTICRGIHSLYMNINMTHDFLISQFRWRMLVHVGIWGFM